LTNIRRREFLKAAGLTGAASIMGCSRDYASELIPFIMPPDSIIPGEATWFATACRECPAGCGLLAKNRDGRVIKLEGNPGHPINKGGLCPRGQASLQGVYNPDRFHGPMARIGPGRFRPISWNNAEARLVELVRHQVERGAAERMAFITDLVTGTLKDLINRWLSEMGAPAPLMHEALAYEPLRSANEIVFGQDGIPSYRIDQADFLIAFGSGFLETWLSNVKYAHQFAAFHTPRRGRKNFFAFVGPRNSLTAANADHWVSVEPGREYLVALGLLRTILDEDICPVLQAGQKAVLHQALSRFPVSEIARKTGIPEKTMRNLGRRFARAERPLALAEGLPHSPNATATAVAANLLCTLISGTAETIDFGRRSALSRVARPTELRELADRMRMGEIELLLIHEANPVFAFPEAWNFPESLERVPAVVSFSSCVDETSQHAHLVLPAHTPLESWGDHEAEEDIVALMQPVMGNLFQSRHLGDILISVGRAIKGTERFPWKDFYAVLQETWQRRWQQEAGGISFESFWLQALQRGGVWGSEGKPPSALRWDPAFDYSFPLPDGDESVQEGFHFVAYPTIQFFDGRMANRPWLQELPDPLTQVTWGGWIEIHPQSAAEFNLCKGDLLKLESPYGSLEAPALPTFTVPPRTVAMPLGQGHTAFGRFATGLPANPLKLFPADLDVSTGGIARPAFKVTMEKLCRQFPVANTDGNFYRQGRKIAETMALGDYWTAVAAGCKPDLDIPLPRGYKRRVDFYPPHPPREYRWCMVVDQDRCIGCGACAVACYAENNLAVVGRRHILEGREMSWIMVQRYFDEKAPHQVGFLVMMCQHCTQAPCESVCPVFAPQHSPEGLNNQVYNRCIGTRDCSQNDPYKVRRFNFFTYTHPFPLDRQLNPDVTVRQKGVMEKCSFCVQRVIQAKIKARDEGRKVKDGEFTTACAQTCPTGALVFGSLLDADSRVSQLIRDPRAYQVLKYLNTKPAVIYLKKLTQALESV
jgi:anaerobic selenocysteine-containing dehydrogenase/Fe-S-cluster-containing dehydrogenase component